MNTKKMDVTLYTTPNKMKKFINSYWQSESVSNIFLSSKFISFSVIRERGAKKHIFKLVFSISKSHIASFTLIESNKMC